MTNRQQTDSQTQLRKSLRRKDISLDKFLMWTKVPYSWGEIPLQTFIARQRSELVDLRQKG